MTSYAVGPALLWGLLWVSVGVLAVQLAMMVGVRLVRAARGRHHGRLVAPLRPLLLELASGDEAAGEEVAAALSGMSGPIRDVVDDSILALMGKIRGDSLAPLVDVLRRHGRDRRARADLRSRSPVRRARAAWTLGVMQEHGAVRRVLPLLQDPAPDVALTAARALGMMGDPVAVTPILAAVAPAGSRPGLPVWIAVESVASLGTVTSPEVCAAVSDPSPDVRTAAAMVIARVPLVAGADTLRGAIDHETEPRLVAVLVVALGAVGGRRDIELLGALLASGHDAQVRRAAIGAVAEVGGSRAVPWLQPLLHSRDIRVAELAATTLVTLGAAGHQAVSAVATSGVLTTSSRLCRYAVAQDALRRSRTLQRAG